MTPRKKPLQQPRAPSPRLTLWVPTLAALALSLVFLVFLAALALI